MNPPRPSHLQSRASTASARERRCATPPSPALRFPPSRRSPAGPHQYDVRPPPAPTSHASPASWAKPHRLPNPSPQPPAPARPQPSPRELPHPLQTPDSSISRRQPHPSRPARQNKAEPCPPQPQSERNPVQIHSSASRAQPRAPADTPLPSSPDQSRSRQTEAHRVETP